MDKVDEILRRQPVLSEVKGLPPNKRHAKNKASQKNGTPKTRYAKNTAHKRTGVLSASE